jgi:nitroimidazol reductase NimA-like FMN-containing flavoprotein (pyridoxamine 5'-phosphate oxidase superfamily)
MTVAVELSPAQCRELLATAGVGRVAMATPVGPRIVPVSYVVHGDAVVFRTAPYSQLSTYGANAELAFEADHVDALTREGWSVVATGRGRVVADPSEVQQIRATGDPEPWVPGARTMYITLPWRELTGRRLVAA